MKSASPDKTSKSAAAAPAKPAAPAKKAAAAPAPAPAPKKPASRKPIVRMSFDGLPTEDQLRAMSDDDYMNDSQLEFFRHRLLQMRAEVLEREVDVKERLHQREVFADPADRATAEEEHWLDLRLRERESLLLRKIDDALRRLENREFGYCEKTGDPIGIPRLLARPTATVCVDVKGQDERVEAQFRDR
ncbi:RNA polymerase-binding protein DksA [Solimonas sp. K1W22B-7]|nr:RNA polymerase-binding protein DksA [Solimonas sp. K1W22B-7]